MVESVALLVPVVHRAVVVAVVLQLSLQSMTT
jgi:hypothetical protein